MPRKGMRGISFHTLTPSFCYRPSSLPTLVAAPPPRLRNFSESAVDQTLEVASTIILKWDPDTTTYAKVTSLFYENKVEAVEFMKHVGELQKIMHLLVNEDSTSYRLGKAHSLMQIAMKRLQKEFYQILSMNRAQLDPESVSTRSSRASARSSLSDFEEDGSGSGRYAKSLSDDDGHIRARNSFFEEEEVSFVAIADLKSIAECMISSGYAKECTQIYRIIRKSIIDEAIHKLGVEKLSATQMNKMSWQILEIKIKSWLESTKLAITTLFHGERILCDTIFSSSDNIRESCFNDISKEGALLLFRFPEQALKMINHKEKKSSSATLLPLEKLVCVLDMYTSIAENWQNIETIFSFESTSIIRSQALNSLIKLSDSVRLMITNFEQNIQKDSSKLIVHGGGVHTLIYNSMDFLSVLAGYSTILVDILVDWSPPSDTLLFPDFYFDSFISDESPRSTVSTAMAWLILVLLCKVDSKAKLYKDVSLSYLFLANNLNHVVGKVRTSNLLYLLGEEWVGKHEAKVKQFATSYEKFAWGPVLSSLPDNPAAVIGAREVKDWFRRFNGRFEETYQKQRSCIISEPKFRDEMKVSIARKLVTTYQTFYLANKVTAGSDLDLKLVIRYAPEDLGNYLSDLFFGTEAAASSTTTTSSSHNKRH
ncbi:hypothetical protein ACFE04_020387 [Oxalis oulophora]